jgi:hypothetical protein
MHKNAMKCNETQSKWCKNKHGTSKIIDTLETYHLGRERRGRWSNHILSSREPNKKVAHPAHWTKQRKWLPLTRWLVVPSSPKGYPLNQTAPKTRWKVWPTLYSQFFTRWFTLVSHSPWWSNNKYKETTSSTLLRQPSALDPPMHYLVGEVSNSCNAM